VILIISKNLAKKLEITKIYRKILKMLKIGSQDATSMNFLCTVSQKNRTFAIFSEKFSKIA
jgi:hypothetical protein